MYILNYKIIDLNVLIIVKSKNIFHKETRILYHRINLIINYHLKNVKMSYKKKS